MWRWIGAIVALALLAGGYFVYPFLTLLRIEAAFRDKDVAALEVLGDWTRIRAGLRGDMMSAFLAADKSESSGSLFLGTAIGGALLNQLLDGLLTPTAMLQHADNPRFRGKSIHDFVDSARFSGPTSFRVDFDIPSETGQSQKCTALMELQGLEWKVVRVIPHDFLRLMNEKQ